MDFQFPHRKMLNDSIADTCKSFCKPEYNPYGGCPQVCMLPCFLVCKYPLNTEIPPPPLDLDSLSDNSSHAGRPLGLSVFLSISLIILATAFFFFTCYSVYKFYKGRYSYRSRQLSSQQQPPSRQPEEEEAHLEFLDEEHGPMVDYPIWYIRTVGLQPSVISAITICKYKKGDGLVEGTDCSVCLSEFQDGETLRLLPKCNHAFHIPCIDTWLASHTNCPNCRAGIVLSTSNLRSTPQSLQSSGLDSGRLEESQVGAASGNNNAHVESEREIESRVLDVSIGVEDEEESRANENSMGSCSSSREVEGIQPLRRSISLDVLSASVINTAIANAFSAESNRNKDKIPVEMNGITVESPPNEAGDDHGGSSSMQKETSLVKRSLSCSAKVFLSRYSKSRNSTSLPPQ